MPVSVVVTILLGRLMVRAPMGKVVVPTDASKVTVPPPALRVSPSTPLVVARMALAALKVMAPPALVRVGLAVSLMGVLKVMAVALVVMAPPRLTEPLVEPLTVPALSVKPVGAVMVLPDKIVNKPLCVMPTAPVTVALSENKTFEEETVVKLAKAFVAPTAPLKVTGPAPAVSERALVEGEFTVLAKRMYPELPPTVVSIAVKPARVTAPLASNEPPPDKLTAPAKLIALEVMLMPPGADVAIVELNVVEAPDICSSDASG